MSVIYGLSDPETGEIRYVGYTAKAAERRLAAHIQEARKGKFDYRHKNWWIRSLLENGQSPRVSILEVIQDGVAWQERESYWIKFLRDSGSRLCNHTSGGDGVRDPDGSVKKRIGDALRGRKLPPRSIEHRQNISRARKGKPKSQEHKDRISASQTGKVYGPASLDRRLKISAKRKAYWQRVHADSMAGQLTLSI